MMSLLMVLLTFLSEAYVLWWMEGMPRLGLPSGPHFCGGPSVIYGVVL